MIDYNKFTAKTIRTAWVKAWTVEFLKGLDAVSGKEAIEEYCTAKKAEYECICQEKSAARLKTETRSDSGVGWQNSASTNMSQIRAAIKAWHDWKLEKSLIIESDTYPQSTKEGIVQQHYSLLYMNYPSEFHAARMLPTNERKKEQRSNLEPIIGVDEYQKTIEELLSKTDYREITAGLIAATGRRPSEILVTAQFKQLGQFEVEFTGQIKNKGEERKPYPTHTLVESYRVIDALAKLRRMPEIKQLKKETLPEVDSGKNNKMNSKVKEYFTPLLNPPMGETELSAKNLRASYAAIAIYLFCPWKQSTNQFITERLGHVSDATATNYEDYQVCDKDGMPLTRGAWVERLNEIPIKPTESIITMARINMTQSAKSTIDDKDFLPFADSVSRIEELIRLAKIGKEFEAGKLVKEVVIMQNQTSQKTTVEISEAQNKPKIRDVSEISNSDLFGSNIPYSGLEKIRRAVEAIKISNSRQAESKYQWAINSKVLKDLTGCRTAIVSSYLNSDEGRLNVHDYNLEKGFTFHHNRNKGNVKDFIKLTGISADTSLSKQNSN